MELCGILRLENNLQNVLEYEQYFLWRICMRATHGLIYHSTVATEVITAQSLNQQIPYKGLASEGAEGNRFQRT